MRYAVALLLLAFLPACGAGTAVSDDVLGDAAAKTIDAGSSRVEATITDSSTGTLHVTGLVDYDASRGRATLDFAAARNDQDVDYASEVIFDENAIYWKVPDVGLPLGIRKPWIKFDRKSEQGPEAWPFGDDPGELLVFLKETSDVVSVGREAVRGAETQHYRGRLDVERALERLPADARENARKTIDEKLREEGLPLEFWIDDDGFLRRVRLELPEEKKEPPVATIDLFDFGVDVDAEPPAADDVAIHDSFIPSWADEYGECKEDADGAYECEELKPFEGGDPCARPAKDERAAEVCAELKKMCAELRKDATEEPEFCAELQRKDDE